ncbi:serine/threonine-protein kinase HT1-like [Cynara cardunculus var. scolymus]|uniref:serine/threonine-protein kinase HT1-like n=1 Tax=Cynara cardunculus var. scolymus TaxID=59895 RepID=UPI000D623DD4|nr:serine/threonine-protein kinase HT1-like [Cynara cardunculus var. scolymus]
MSQLFIGNKFAMGRHSRIYRGVYKQKDVAVKLISQPEEDPDLASMLEKQFTSEVVLFFRLKHPNIITLGEDMCVKVADFGISCLESQCGSAKGFTGTYRWMAPEMIEELKHTKKIDVYSFAVVLWELLTALTPFDDMTPEQAAFAVCQKVTELREKLSRVEEELETERKNRANLEARQAASAAEQARQAAAFMRQSGYVFSPPPDPDS